MGVYASMTGNKQKSPWAGVRGSHDTLYTPSFTFTAQVQNPPRGIQYLARFIDVPVGGGSIFLDPRILDDFKQRSTGSRDTLHLRRITSAEKNKNRARGRISTPYYRQHNTPRHTQRVKHYATACVSSFQKVCQSLPTHWLLQRYHRRQAQSQNIPLRPWGWAYTGRFHRTPIQVGLEAQCLLYAYINVAASPRVLVLLRTYTIRQKKYLLSILPGAVRACRNNRDRPRMSEMPRRTHPTSHGAIITRTTNRKTSTK